MRGDTALLADKTRLPPGEGVNVMIVSFRRIRAGFLAVAASGSVALGQPATDGAFPVAFQDRMTLVRPARAEAERQLGRQVELDVSSMLYKDSWVFLMSRMVDAGGAPLDPTGTKLEPAARQGGASRVFCALLHFESKRWKVIASCLGVTDVAWAGWARRYRAPPEIFELDEN